MTIEIEKANLLIDNFMQEYKTFISYGSDKWNNQYILIDKNNLENGFRNLANKICDDNPEFLESEHVELFLYLVLISEGVVIPKPDELSLIKIPKSVIVHCLAMLLGGISGSITNQGAMQGIIFAETALLINIMSNYHTGNDTKSFRRIFKKIKNIDLRNGEYTQIEIWEELKKIDK